MPNPEASRRNGALSRGPKTAEGKRISALNALTHGLTSKTMALSTENAEEWKPILEEYLAYYRPEGPGETSLTRELAALDWQKARIIAFGTALLEMGIQSYAEHLQKKQPNLTPQQRAAYSFYQATSGSDRSFELLMRYENNLRRCYSKTLEQLLKIQKDRRSAQSGDWRNEPKMPPPAPAAPPAAADPNEPKTQEPESAREPSIAADNQPQTSDRTAESHGVNCTYTGDTTNSDANFGNKPANEHDGRTRGAGRLGSGDHRVALQPRNGLSVLAELCQEPRLGPPQGNKDL